MPAMPEMPKLRQVRRRPVPLRPWRELEEWRRQFDEEFTRPLARAIWARLPEEEKGWAAPVDLYEKGEVVVARIELPGVKQEDIDVSVDDDVLTVKAEKKVDTTIKEEDFLRSEIDYGEIFRSVTLPAGIDTKNVDAVFNNGVLSVTMHRVAGAKPKKITIQVKKEE